MSDTIDLFSKIGRPNPLNSTDNYIMSHQFKSFFLDVAGYFMDNLGDSLYGISMTPKGADAIITLKIAGIYPYAEESLISIEDILLQCDAVSFTPKVGHMVFKIKFKNAFEIVDDSSM